MDRDYDIRATSSVLSRQEMSQQSRSASANGRAALATSSTPRSRRAVTPGNLGRPSPSLPKGAGAIVSKMDDNSPHHKAGRVKVGVRCRPAFDDELAFAAQRGETFESIVGTREEGSGQELGQVSLTMLSGKRREFLFDYVFSSEAPQDQVYERLARPVVSDVIRGFNGTIFAYGQTGTGKTYTMGILESVRNEHAGIIPRALAQLFEHVNGPHNEAADIQVTLSFLQLYRETIQDLLAPAVLTQSSSGVDENLQIREDPQRGFYVEGLQEFIVRNYSEAEALVNLGLENRAIAPTLMNATSSRSHTVLTLCLEQRGSRSDPSAPAGVHSRLMRSKLLLVDLAGSERVRRTVSKGTRLNEARSINTSLSALGNVIAALAEDRPAHIPYRDSKLTRLLQDSLGGTASTALVATVGPSAINYGETLSTILFSARCMAVKTTPIKHEEVDFPDLCARLQARVAQLEGQMAERSLDLQVKYENVITQLRAQLEAGGMKQSGKLAPGSEVGYNSGAGVSQLLKYLGNMQSSPNASNSRGWIDRALRDRPENSYLLPLLEYSFSLLRGLAEDFDKIIKDNASREEEHRRTLIASFASEADQEAARELEAAHFSAHDPLAAMENGPLYVGGHLATLSSLEALTRVEGLYRIPGGITAESLSSHEANWKNLGVYDSILSYDDPKEVAEALARVHALTLHNMKGAAALMLAKDSAFAEVKSELVEQMVERRQREEEVVNWSCILKYLLSASTKLKRQLKQEQQLPRTTANKVALSVGTADDQYDARGKSGYISASGTPQSVYGADFRRLEVPYSAHSTAVAEDSPLFRVRQRMSRLAEEDKDSLRNSSHQPTSLQSRLARAGSATQRALTQNRATLRAAQEDEEIDQISDVYGSDEMTHAHTIPVVVRGRTLRSPSPIVRNNSPSSSASRSMRARSESPQTRSASPTNTPSGYAQSVVRGLGVQGAKASAAAQIVDKVVKLTPAQLASMDPQTREQVMRVRRDLGIDSPHPQATSAARKTSPRNGNGNGNSNGNRVGTRSARESYDSDEEFSQIA